MSRAFVKESDRDEAVVRAEPELPPGVPKRITPAGASRFREALAAAIADRAAARAEDGAAARARLAEAEATIAWIERRIATFVETPTPKAPTRVVFGAGVRLVGDAGERRLRIVGVDEVDPANGAVSWASPLARAVLGGQVGDEVTVDLPRGRELWEIVEIFG